VGHKKSWALVNITWAPCTIRYSFQWGAIN